MYEYITGTITDFGTDYVVSDVAGVGYLIYCSTNTQNHAPLGQKVKLYIHMHVAEDAMTLFGFHSQEEREMFRRLMAVTRIGKKLALSVLSVMTPADIAMAVATDNAKAFDNVPGLGKKTAQRVILELKEKVDLMQTVTAADDSKAGDDAIRAEAIEALCMLGYDGLTAGRAVGEVQGFENVEDLIKKALAIASGRK